ncbi:MAG TPA: hypothetical protein PLN19_01405 [Methanothrix sp.]|jgi:hypothetical protein|uniref:hypothetical protein n=1 Tax=Methanothrix sp. TaxID=90426 RepID=UPI002C9C6904|nr:hypothetical protein [Methanothrix sp.]HQE86907.1 hypothetical protein [Methanothrix sp.]HQI67850.1 hypothetical protein [Methanothrix sp.]HRU76433.1 hypothetical protein [Methanothrix sp.]
MAVHNLKLLIVAVLCFLVGMASATTVEVFTANHVGFGDQEWVDWSDKLSYNAEEIERLQKTLNKDHYNQSYEVNVFDCADASILCEQWLEKHGYDAYILVDVNRVHAWVVVRFDDGSYVPVEATADMAHTMGKINWNPKYLQGYVYDTALELMVATGKI